MINGNFFIEHSEVIGLWIIYSIVILLIYSIFDYLISSIVSRVKRVKKMKLRKIQVNNRLANKSRVSSQIRKIMNIQL